MIPSPLTPDFLTPDLTSDCDCCPLPQPPSGHKTRRLWLALILIIAAAGLEFGVALVSHSLSLLAESGHMVSDGVALGLALLAAWIAQWPATPQAPFGFRRVEILAALVNGVGLLAVAIWIGWEAIAHLTAPPHDILSLPMLVTATVGLLVNSVNAALLHPHSHDDLNVRGAFLHMLADVASAVGVLIAAIAIGLWHWLWIDSVISLGVAVLIGFSALPFIRQSLVILLEFTPNALDVDAIRDHLHHFPAVQQVERLKVWAIAPGQVMVMAQLTTFLEDGTERDRLLAEIQTSLQTTFGVAESVIQLGQMMQPLPTISLSVPNRLISLVEATETENP